MSAPVFRKPLGIVLAVTSMGVTTFALLTPALPDLADALGVSRSSIGFIHGAAAFPGVVLAVLIGHIADVRGRRFLAVWALVAFGVAGVSGFFMREFWLLVGVRAIQGIGASAILSLGVMLIGDLYPEVHERRRALGINGAFLMGAATVAPIVGGTLASVDPFLPFLVYSLAFPLAWWARGLPVAGADTKPPPVITHLRGMLASLRASNRLSDFLGLLPFTVVLMIVFNGSGFTGTPLYLEEVFSLEAAARGLVQTGLPIGSITASLLSARVARRYGPARTLSVGFTLVVLAFAVVTTAPVVPVAVAGLWLMGTGVGLVFPLISDFVTSSVTRAHRGAAVGMWLASLRLGQTIGPVLGGVAVTSLGGRQAFGVSTVVFALLGFSWIPLRRLARTRIGRHPPPVQDPLTP